MSHHVAQSVPNPANAPSAGFFGGVGIKPGMRVLDVGCGHGDLSRFVAGLAGPDGEVIAIDRSEQVLELARAADTDALGAPIDYRAVDLSGRLPDLGRFDAIVGRRVLMYLPEPAETLRRLAALANPGALLAFQEHARAGLPVGAGDLPLHRQLYDWVWNTVTAEGGDTHVALRLVDILRSLGLCVQPARSEAILLDPDEPSFLPTLAQQILPRVIEQNVASMEEIGPDTLADRIDDERRGIGGTIIWDLALLVTASTKRHDTA